MIEYIQKNTDDIVLEEVAVGDFPKELSSINEPHVDSVDISEPVILAEISPGRYNLIDGNHRMEKARRLGIKNIQAYKLNAKVDQALSQYFGQTDHNRIAKVGVRFHQVNNLLCINFCQLDRRECLRA